MDALNQPLEDLPGFPELCEAVRAGAGMHAVTGCTDAQKPHLIHAVSRVWEHTRLIVVPEEERARELLAAYRFFEPGAVYFPAKDVLFYQADIRGMALMQERMAVYRALRETAAPAVITTFDALMERLAPPRTLAEECLHLARGATVDLAALREQLVRMGYEYEDPTEDAGQFAVRGGILDVFPLTEETPYRIELWGDTVDSIRSFSPVSQRSLEAVEELTVYPANDAPNAPGDSAGLLDYLDRPLVFVDEPARCLERGKAVAQELTDSMAARAKRGEDVDDPADVLIPAEAVTDALGRCPGLLLANLETRFDGFSLPGDSDGVPTVFPLTVTSIHSYQGDFSLLVKDLTSYKKEGYRVVLLAASRTRSERLARDLREEGLTAFTSGDSARLVAPGEILVRYGALPQGFAYPDIRFAVLTETDIFGAQKSRPKKAKRAGADAILSSDDLRPGDYVIHESHGLGIYRGMEQVEIDYTPRDYMKIEYEGGSFLYVPAAQLDVISRYTGADGQTPRLDHLGGQEWKRTRRRVRQSVQTIARELVELYAARQHSTGYSYGPDTPWQREFEEMFPYEETEDQLTAIAEIKADMESPKIMDRLLCGDVGFGKTEVALRAAFKAVQENKQVVYLVPTTILAQQHYNNFAERLSGFPVNVELLCRFRTAAQQRETVRRLREGSADIVIGTHRVLSADVEYKDLGLLIIDEEQRFGVSHKEKIKQMKQTVDVLSLSATPIPRTLHMSMIGIRDMSVLTQPPQDRLPIQTYVMEYDEEMVREAIARELARGGQVYYVYNRVKTIADWAARVAALVPDARVAYAHGQMSERELENVMERFIEGEIDVLVTTTIIETGMDIANVNTMIVHDAEAMGLAQLYQLRGRIGRSNRRSYAFLMYRRDRMLPEVAERRLAAIREFSDLGSGIHIARKDLEIRGAGNLLGEQQHGHMEAVGYELYCKMLGDAVREAKGEAPVEEFATSVDLDIPAYIPSEYIENEYQKLDIYRRIAAVRTEEERDAMRDELVDRYGQPPRPVENLLSVAILRERAHALYMTEIKESPAGISFALYERAALDPAKIPDAVAALQPGLSFAAGDGHPRFLYRRQDTDGSALRAVRRVLDVCAKTLA